MSYATGAAESGQPDADNLDMPLLGDASGYTLTESTAANDGWLTITKYLVDSSSGELTSVNYDVSIKHLGDAGGDTTLYFQWEDATTEGYSYKRLTQTDSLEAGGVSITVDSAANQRVTEGVDSISNSFAGLNSYDVAGDTLEGGGAISKITSDTIMGDFAANTISSITRDLTGTSSGGAIGHNATANDISGTFVGNRAQGSGGAIAHNITRKNSIIGDFIGNSALTGDGGAITALQQYVELIQGDFIANRAGGSGGALYLINVSVGTVNSDFFNNDAAGDGAALAVHSGSKLSTVTGDFSGNSSDTNGGAVSVQSSQAGAITGDFIGNTAAGSGGAIYNRVGDVGLLAVEQNMYFTGNTADGKSNAIYNYGFNLSGGDAVMHFDAFGDSRIIVNDGISGRENSVTRQIFYINSGYSADGYAYDYPDLEHSTVEFNNTVENQTIHVLKATLKLGTYGGSFAGTAHEIAASEALLSANVVQVYSGATLDAHSGGALGASASANVISNSGVVTFGEGTLINDMSLVHGGELALTGKGGSSSTVSITGAGNKITGTGRSNQVSGTINIAAGAELTVDRVALSANTTVNNEGARGDAILRDGIVTDITLGALQTLSGVDTSSIAGYEGSATTVDLHIYDMLNVGAELNALSMEGSITFDIPMSKTVFDAHFETDSDAQYLIFQYGEGSAAFGSDYGALLESELEVYLNVEGSLHKASYNFVNADGGLAMAFELMIPEPSTATLSLLALTGLIARRRREIIRK